MDMFNSLEEFEKVFKPMLSIFSTLAILTEIGLILYRRQPWSIKSRGMNVLCFVVAAGSGGLFTATVAYHVHDFVYDYRLFDFGFAWYGWVLCFVLIDCMFYVTHRLHHRIRALWCVHSVHHSAEEFELTVGIRGSFLDTATQFPVYAWLPLVGIHPLMYLITDTAFKFLIFVYHTEFVKKLGVLEKVIVTPASHRVHHGKDVKYLDTNYGGVFIALDRLLGTYQPEEERPTYGVRNKPASYNIFKAQGGEFAALVRDVKRAPGLGNKLKYIFKPPGWRHDGPGETSDELKARQASELPSAESVDTPPSFAHSAAS